MMLFSPTLMIKRDLRSLASPYFDKVYCVSKINLLKILDRIDSNSCANCRQSLCLRKTAHPIPTDALMAAIGAGLMIYCIKMALDPVGCAVAVRRAELMRSIVLTMFRFCMGNYLSQSMQILSTKNSLAQDVIGWPWAARL